MDPLTHGLAGAVAAQSAAPAREIRTAGTAGFLSGMLADLDYFFHHSADPLFQVEIHRQFTHSLIFIPVGALVATLLLIWFMRRRIGPGKLYLYAFLSYGTAGILDTCTSYGTQLLWPFDETRYAWNLISVLDPVFTAGLFVLAILSWIRKKPKLSRWAIAWVILYLFFGYLQKERAKTIALECAENRGDSVERIVVKPTIGNQLLWRSTYEHGGYVLADAIRVGLPDGSGVYKGERAPLLSPEQEWSDWKGTTLYGDLLRFDRLSEGWLIRHPDDSGIVGDARYAMLPTSLTPLWGVRLTYATPDRHLPFLYFRDAGPEVREPFWNMLSGKGGSYGVPKPPDMCR